MITRMDKLYLMNQKTIYPLVLPRIRTFFPVRTNFEAIVSSSLMKMGILQAMLRALQELTELKICQERLLMI